MPKQENRTKFDLSEPVKDLDGTELHALYLREPRTKDLRVVDNADGEIAGALALIASLAGIAESDVDEMALADLMPIMSWLGNVLPAGAGIGKSL